MEGNEAADGLNVKESSRKMDKQHILFNFHPIEGEECENRQPDRHKDSVLREI